ncbi:hypothetical protein EON80_01515 [bacterium]|nr:MAG: hypothetical protein EON80_01515 [bacterium]
MWLALTLTSFVTFLASMAALTRRGFAADGTFQRVGAAFIAAAALSAVVWVVSLSQLPPPYPLENIGRYEAPNFPVKAAKP